MFMLHDLIFFCNCYCYNNCYCVQLRMVNAGGRATLELIVVDSLNNKACTYMEISTDGIYLDQARTPRFDKTLLPPSGKADWLIVCNTPGTYQVGKRSHFQNTNSKDANTRHPIQFSLLQFCLFICQVASAGDSEAMPLELGMRQQIFF